MIDTPKAPRVSAPLTQGQVTEMVRELAEAEAALLAMDSYRQGQHAFCAVCQTIWAATERARARSK